MTTAIRAELALRQRIEDRVYSYGLDMPRELQPVPAFNPELRQADVIGACQVVNRYRCHGPILTWVIGAYNFFGRASVPALFVVVGLSGLAMKVVA